MLMQIFRSRRGRLPLCAGITLIEMIVSLMLAMVLLVSLVMLYFGAAKTAAKEENITSANRAGRLISRRLARDFRLIGLMANEDVDGDSNDICDTCDVPGLVWSDGERTDFEWATTYDLAYVGDIDNDDHTETVYLHRDSTTGDLIQETWEWSTASVSWVGPVVRTLGTNVDYIMFDYFDRNEERVPDTTGWPVGGFVLDPGERRWVTSVEVTLCVRSASPENRQPEAVTMPDGTTFDDTFRRAVFQFEVRGRNLTLGA